MLRPSEECQLPKDLRVLLDEKLNFEYHNNFIGAKAKSTLAWIEIFLYDDSCLNRPFETFMMPILEYASQI